MPFLADTVELIDDSRYTYRANGISYLIHFHGLDYDVNNCEIVAGSGDYPLTGNSDLESNSTVIQTYGDSLFFPVIPMEFLAHDAQAPQIRIVVDGRLALCTDLICDYSYVTSESLVSSQSLTDASVLTITGTSLPTNDASLNITLGPISCTQTSVSETEIKCTLDDTRVSGEWIAVLVSDSGLIPNEISTAISIVASVSSISPSTDINFLGGTEMTITGDSFGYDTSVISVTYVDGTECVVSAVDMTSITCVNSRFTSDADETQTLTVSINNAVDSSTLSVTLKTTIDATLELNPSSVSPVLKTEITIYLDSSYANTLDAEDFTAVLYSLDDTTYERELYVMSVDDDAKTVKIKFPGAVSGDYFIQLSSVQSGYIDSDLLNLSVHGTVTSVSPLTGSKYGGALITITGENFSDDGYDNPVKIGDDNCYVQTSSPTEITCRTDLHTTKETGSELFVVFLKTSEEAATPDGEDIIFTYAAPTVEVTDMYVTFDEVTLTHQIILAGTGFDETIEVVIDGYVQTLVSQDAYEAIFTLTNLSGVDSSDVHIYTSEGYPEGGQISHAFEAYPAILTITPSVGSSGGSIISVTGSGFGTETVGLNLLADGETLCSVVEITAYGEFTCLTNAIEVAEGAVITVVVVEITQLLSHVATDAIYSQTESITVTAADLSSNTITFTGTGFPISDYTAFATFAGLTATSVTIVSAVSVIASWDVTGVPGVTEAPVLYFEYTDGTYSHYASIDSSVSISKTLDVSATTDSLVCSFAGGCTYAIASDGLYASLLNSDNSVEICGSPCTLREDLSDYSFAVCELPGLATTYSVDNYQITESAILYGTVFPEGTNLHDD